MELFIKIENGQAVNHPIMEDNFRQAFPEIDTNNLPSNFARFIRVDAPALGVYEKNQTVTYQLQNGVWTDVYACEQMTQEEIVALQNQVKDEFAQNYNFASWTFNEATCQFEPPISCPNDGKPYKWDEEIINWVESTGPTGNTR